MATEATIDGKTFEIGKLNAFEQLHVFRRVMPIMKPVLQVMRTPGGVNQLDMVMAMSETLSTLPDEQLDYVINKCLSVIRVKDDARGMSFPVMRGATMMYQDFDMPQLLRLTWEVLMENFQPFFKGLLVAPSKGEAAGPLTT
jgi:hypothetical protein